MFDGWLRPSTPTNDTPHFDTGPSTPPSNRMSVSEPVLLSPKSGSAGELHGEDEPHAETDDDFDAEEFARMVVCSFFIRVQNFA